MSDLNDNSPNKIPNEEPPRREATPGGVFEDMRRSWRQARGCFDDDDLAIYAEVEDHLRECRLCTAMVRPFREALSIPLETPRKLLIAPLGLGGRTLRVPSAAVVALATVFLLLATYSVRAYVQTRAQNRELEAVQYYDQAVRMREEGQFQDAIRYFEKARSIKPDWVNAVTNEAQIYAFNLPRKDWGRAGELFRKALQLDDTRSGNWHDLGIVLRNQGKDREALSAFDEALKIRPNDLESLQDSAQILAFKMPKGERDPARAAERFRRVVRMDPGNLRCWYNLGVTDKASGNRSEAIQAFEHVLQLSNTGVYHDGAIKNLKELRKP